MESTLNFRLVGNYSIQQTDWRMAEDRPREDCCRCHNAKYATILVSESWQDDSFVCVECLLKENSELKLTLDIVNVKIKELRELYQKLRKEP